MAKMSASPNFEIFRSSTGKTKRADYINFELIIQNGTSSHKYCCVNVLLRCQSLSLYSSFL